MQQIRSKNTRPVHSPFAGMKQILSVLPDTFPEYGDGDWDIACACEKFLLCTHKNFCRKSTIYKGKGNDVTDTVKKKRGEGKEMSEDKTVGTVNAENEKKKERKSVS